VVGAGGLGSPVIAYLAGAGVGRLGIVDHDKVSLSNLPRQVIHCHVGLNKARSAAQFARTLNPHVDVEVYTERLDEGNAGVLIAQYDLVLDGTDNLKTRRIVADMAARRGVTLVSGAVSMFDGQITIFPPRGPQFSSLYPAEADDGDLPSCEVAGILGPLTGVIGTLMAMEAIKLITGIGEPLIGRVLTYDGKTARFSEILL
jgi:molybdopterin/thiamine biosynthesis adenylyltransferase